MSQLLVNQIRKQREFKKAVTDGKTGRVYTFTCKRPTDQERMEMRAGELLCDVAQRFVIGWEGVTENDVVGGGGSDVLEFDALLWREWCADRIDFWGPCPAHSGGEPGIDECPKCAPIPKAIFGAYREHSKAMEDAAKNSQPGSNNAT